MNTADFERPDLEQVHELNRLFLRYLQAQARNTRFCLGLSSEVVALLREARSDVLDQAAELPRALFRLKLGDTAAGDRLPAAESRETRALLSLQLTLILTVWIICRQSPYRARAFCGLTSRAVQRLRALSLSELPSLAVTAQLVACSFGDADWLWRELLTPHSATSHQQLKLVALQPTNHDAPAR